MQNIPKPSSHCPERNSSFYCTEEAIDFPYTPPLCSDSVYSWVLTGLPQAALHACCSPHNLHAYNSSKSKGKCTTSTTLGCEAGVRNCGHSLFFAYDFQSQRLPQLRTLIPKSSCLTSVKHQKEHLVTSTQLRVENSAKQLMRSLRSELNENQTGVLRAQSLWFGR